MSDLELEDPFNNFVIDEDCSNNGETGTKKADRESVPWKPEVGRGRKQRNKMKKTSRPEVHAESQSAGTSEQNGRGKSFPNYLIAMQITNPKIYASLQQVQEHVISQNEKLEPSLQPIGLMHLSMFMTRLDTEEEVTRAMHALDQCKHDLGQLYKDHPVSLDICGLGNFRDKVVFAKVKDEAQEDILNEAAAIIEQCFQNQGILTATNHGFSPHVTVLNLSRDKSSRTKGGLKKIDPTLYKKYVNTDFGHQFVNTLQLCPMMKKKLPSGYYDVEYTVQFGPDIEDNTNDLTSNSCRNSKTAEDLVGRGVEESDENKTAKNSSANRIASGASENRLGNVDTSEVDYSSEYHSKFGWC